MEEDTQRYAKRRKIDDSRVQTGTSYHKYGYYGQVEPGRLKLDLLCCTGGIHNDGSQVYFGPENILQHDQSVYSSRESQCSLVFRHFDTTPFSLESLYLITPNSGFTAPVKDGHAYIAMSLEDLQPYMESDGGPESPQAPRSPLSPEPTDERLSLLESLNDPEISRAMAQRPPRDLSPADWLAEQLMEGSNRPAHGTTRGASPSDPGVDDEAHPSLIPTRLRATHNMSPPPEHQAQVAESGHHISLLDDEVVRWPEEPTRSDVLADRHRRELRMRQEEEDAQGWDPRFRSSRYSRFRGSSRALRSPRAAPSRRSSVPAPSASTVVKAQFHIRSNKHKVAIKFDPPV